MTAVKSRQIVMVGADLRLPGGINAVVASYRAAGLLDAWGVQYLVSYRGRAMLVQLQTMARAIARFVVWLVRRRVLLVHVHSASRGSFWRKSIFCGLAWLARVPYIFHLHSGEFAVFYLDECGALSRAWVRWVLRHARTVAVLTPHWGEVLRGIEPRMRTKLLVNPVALPLRCNTVRDRPQRLLFLGRLLGQKGVFDLLSAMPAVLSAWPEVRLCLAGDGDRSAVTKVAVSLGVAEAIDMPGWIDGEAKEVALGDADVLVLPSYYEGLPLCVLEAMAAGVPVVATRVGGIPFALDEGRCGVLVEPGRPDDLAHALVGLLGDGERREALRQAARKRAESVFSAAKVAEDVDALWSTCGGKPPVGSLHRRDAAR